MRLSPIENDSNGMSIAHSDAMKRLDSSALCLFVVLAHASPLASQAPPHGDSGDPLDQKTRQIVALQVALDRAGFSPGEIDGAAGTNTERALAAFKAAGKTLPQNAEADAIVSYTIAADMLPASLVPHVPEDMMEKAKLPALSYTSLLEAVAERYHASPKLLRRLNPHATFAEGEAVNVPNVDPFVMPANEGSAKPTAQSKRTPAKEQQAQAKPSLYTVTVTDESKTLQVEDANGQVVFHAPVTVGSANDPLPVGEWKVTGISRNPVFNYNPTLFWDADPSHAKAKIPPGPNNPVGVVWIDLSKPHYGIHGTPEPSRIGYTQSHGCIRLTNWDAMRLAALVSPGTKVVLR
jgi:lipoprotein-anchoring transpeptidase ErfK/SrfK